MMPLEVARAASWLMDSRNMLILAGISACPHSTYKPAALGIGICIAWDGTLRPKQKMSTLLSLTLEFCRVLLAERSCLHCHRDFRL